MVVGFNGVFAMTPTEQRALSIAVRAILGDEDDYIAALWQIVEAIGGEEAAEMIERDPQRALKTYRGES